MVDGFDNFPDLPRLAAGEIGGFEPARVILVFRLAAFVCSFSVRGARRFSKTARLSVRAAMICFNKSAFFIGAREGCCTQPEWACFEKTDTEGRRFMV